MTTRLPGRLVAVGSLGVVLASLFYALAPVRAALPMPVLEVSAAMADTVTGANLLRAAGSIGMVADLVLIVGSLLVAASFYQRALLRSAAGWAGLALATLIFVHVDALAAAVLPAMSGATSADTGGWEAVRRLFDVLWLLGGAAFGVSALMVASGKGALTWAQRAGGAATLAGVLGILLGFNTAQVMGVGLAFGALAFAIVGLRFTKVLPSGA